MEYQLISKDLREAHHKLGLQLKFFCTNLKHESENNEVDTMIPFLGLEWDRRTDSISFNGTFTLSKKNRMGQSKHQDISNIDKKFFKDLSWLKQHVNKRVILRLTMSHFDPLGCLLSVSLTNFKLLASRVMELTDTHKYDQLIENDEFLMKVGKQIELLSNYKQLAYLSRALIPANHRIFAVSIYKNGSISSQSGVSYILCLSENNLVYNINEKSPQRVENSEYWLKQHSLKTMQPIFPESADNFISQV